MIALAAALVLQCTAPAVHDGDTLRCAGRRVRLWGVQAPELSERPAGPRSRAALSRLTRGPVVCRERPSGSPDRYGRVVALCTSRGRDLAGELVRQGHARDWPRYSGGYYSEVGR